MGRDEEPIQNDGVGAGEARGCWGRFQAVQVRRPELDGDIPARPAPTLNSKVSLGGWIDEPLASFQSCYTSLLLFTPSITVFKSRIESLNVVFSHHKIDKISFFVLSVWSGPGIGSYRSGDESASADITERRQMRHHTQRTHHNAPAPPFEPVLWNSKRRIHGLHLQTECQAKAGALVVEDIGEAPAPTPLRYICNLRNTWRKHASAPP